MSWRASGAEHLRAEFVLVASEPDVGSTFTVTLTAGAQSALQE